MRKLKALIIASSLSVAGIWGAVQPAVAQSEPYLGQLMLTAMNFCPRGWAEADGQLLPISSNSALFSVLGTYYGGDGRTTFALPDLRGRAPIHKGNGPGLQNYSMGQRGGSESFSVLSSNMPSHTHAMFAAQAAGNNASPTGNFPASAANAYHSGPADTSMATNIIAPAGGAQPIDHRGPYLAMTYCIALQGIYPSRN